MAYPNDASSDRGLAAGVPTDRTQDVKDTARAEAADVKNTAQQAGGDVVASAKEQAGNVVDEAKYQGQRLLDQGVSELRSQASSGQEKIAGIVRSLTDELSEMVRSSNTDGPVAKFASNAEGVGDRAARWLESNDPQGILDDVRRFAARRPWAFMAISAGVGLLGSRLVRGLQGASQDEKQLTGGAGYGASGRPGYAQADTARDAGYPAGAGYVQDPTYDRDTPYGQGTGFGQGADGVRSEVSGPAERKLSGERDTSEPTVGGDAYPTEGTGTNEGRAVIDPTGRTNLTGGADDLR